MTEKNSKILGIDPPSFHYAKGKLQKDLEMYLEKTGLNISKKQIKKHAEKGFYGGADAFVYTLLDNLGNEVGTVKYTWNGHVSPISYDIKDSDLSDSFNKEFEDASDRLRKYSEEHLDRPKSGNLSLNGALEKFNRYFNNLEASISRNFSDKDKLKGLEKKF